MSSRCATIALSFAAPARGKPDSSRQPCATSRGRSFLRTSVSEQFEWRRVGSEGREVDPAASSSEMDLLGEYRCCRRLSGAAGISAGEAAASESCSCSPPLPTRGAGSAVGAGPCHARSTEVTRRGRTLLGRRAEGNRAPERRLRGAKHETVQPTNSAPPAPISSTRLEAWRSSPSTTIQRGRRIAPLGISDREACSGPIWRPSTLRARPKKAPTPALFEVSSRSRARRPVMRAISLTPDHHVVHRPRRLVAGGAHCAAAFPDKLGGVSLLVQTPKPGPRGVRISCHIRGGRRRPRPAPAVSALVANRRQILRCAVVTFSWNARGTGTTGGDQCHGSLLRDGR